MGLETKAVMLSPFSRYLGDSHYRLASNGLAEFGCDRSYNGGNRLSYSVIAG